MMKGIEKRVLGKSGLEITKLGLGLWPVGSDGYGITDDQESIKTIEVALDMGINFYDTADVYGFGHSEELLGKVMQGRRDKFIIATKIGWIGFDGEKQSTVYTTVEKLVVAVEEALKRLRTDYIDLMQSHINFRDKTMEIFLEGFQKLQQEGKIRSYGVSTSDFEYLKQFNADEGCASLQIDYSILNRTPEFDFFPYCQEHKIGILVRGPLAMGILTGKFTSDAKFGERDFRVAWQEEPERHQIFLEDLKKVDKLKPLLNKKTMTQLALQFSMEHPAITSSIPGAKTVKQLNENMKAAFLPALTKKEVKVIDSITPAGGGRKIWPA
jgi:aryl-alcohol dehydrogenase-like predicted oxidoreductase